MRNFNFICMNAVSPAIKQIVSNTEIQAANENDAYTKVARVVLKNNKTFTHLNDCVNHISSNFYAY